MKPSRYLSDLLRRTTPEQAVIKKKAHAATVAAAALVVPSLCAIYFCSAGLKENEPEWVWAALTAWKIHAAVIAVALLFWIFEQPKLAKLLPVEPLDADEGNSEESKQPTAPKPPKRHGSSERYRDNMSRFKTGARIEDAIKRRDRQELIWAEAYAQHRWKTAGMKQHEKHWRSVAKRVKDALDAVPEEKTNPASQPASLTRRG